MVPRSVETSSRYHLQFAIDGTDVRHNRATEGPTMKTKKIIRENVFFHIFILIYLIIASVDFFVFFFIVNINIFLLLRRI